MITRQENWQTRHVVSNPDRFATPPDGGVEYAFSYPSLIVNQQAGLNHDDPPPNLSNRPQL